MRSYISFTGTFRSRVSKATLNFKMQGYGSLESRGCHHIQRRQDWIGWISHSYKTSTTWCGGILSWQGCSVLVNATIDSQQHPPPCWPSSIIKLSSFFILSTTTIKNDQRNSFQTLNRAQLIKLLKKKYNWGPPNITDSDWRISSVEG